MKLKSMNIKAKEIFENCISFYEELGFTIFDYNDLDDFFKRFKKGVEERFRESIEEIDEIRFRSLIFRYLGFDTKYGFSYDFDLPSCSQIWNFIPYIEDFYEDQIGFINTYLERVVGKSIPISEIEYRNEDPNHFLKFKYKGKFAALESDHLTLLSFNYIIRVTQFTKNDTSIDNLYILEHFHSDEPVLFTINEEKLEKLIGFLKIEKNRISQVTPTTPIPPFRLGKPRHECQCCLSIILYRVFCVPHPTC